MRKKKQQYLPPRDTDPFSIVKAIARPFELPLFRDYMTPRRRNGEYIKRTSDVVYFSTNHISFLITKQNTMPDLFDNFFGRISTTMNGGKSKPRYGGSNQVNSGKYYSYHSSSTNNNSWMPIKKPAVEKDHMDPMETMQQKEPKQRMGSIGSMISSDSAESQKD